MVHDVVLSTKVRGYVNLLCLMKWARGGHIASKLGRAKSFEKPQCAVKSLVHSSHLLSKGCNGKNRVRTEHSLGNWM